MGGLVAQFVSAATATIKRRAIAYALWVASGLLLIFAAGYALNALHASLMFRWGSIAASLAVAGGLLFCALGLAVAGYILSRTGARSISERLAASPEVTRITKYLSRPKRGLAPAAAGALAGAVTVVTLAFLRRTPATRHRDTGGSARHRDIP